MTSPETASAAAKLASYLSQYSPVPAFPEYTGPYKVGTVDVEIPVTELDSPSPAPDKTDDIHTVQFRVFYPATSESDGKNISWLPAPQRHHVSAYTQFIGLKPLLAEMLSYVPWKTLIVAQLLAPVSVALFNRPRTPRH